MVEDAKRTVTNFREPGNSRNDISRLIHHDDSASAETGLSIFERVEIHPRTNVGRVGER